MLPIPPSPVKPFSLKHEQITIWLLFGGLALLLWATNLDNLLAQTTYHPDLSHTANRLAKLFRTYSTLPAAILALFSLIAMFWPALWRKRPTLYQTAAVMVLTSVLGVGLVNQIVIKQLADRPRPHEVLLASPQNTLNPASDGFRGNSMPSGHAAMGFVLAAPFFPLRRTHRKLAITFLGTGLTMGFIIGLSRMALGAHFATDVLIAAAIALSTASLFTLLMQKIRRIPTLLIASGMLIAALAVILGNKFTNLTLTLEVPQPFTRINLPCSIQASPAAVSVPTLTVNLSGYGAPLSLLKLTNHNNTVSLQKHFGLYHNLTCTAQLALPPTE